MTATIERKPLEFPDVLRVVWAGATTPAEAFSLNVSEHFLLNVPLLTDEEFDALAARPVLSEAVLGRLVDLARAGGPVNTRRHQFATYAALYRSGHPLPPESLESWTHRLQWLVVRDDLPSDGLEALAVYAGHPDVTDEMLMEAADRSCGYRAFQQAAPNHPVLLALDLVHRTSRTRPAGVSNGRWALTLAAMIRDLTGDDPSVLVSVGPLVREMTANAPGLPVEDLLEAAFSAVRPA